ncbi:MAG: NADH-quinone oxidoreductase subunit N [Proteobacteria bacterium]|nr:NADH-quinone oxidoreductase subunit N [Pseudomonadota bacterium]
MISAMSPSLMQDLILNSPLIAVSLGALVIMILEVVLNERWPRAEVAAFFLLVALVLLVWNTPGFSPLRTSFGGMVFADPFAAFVTFIVLFGSVLSLIGGVNRLTAQGIESKGEFYALLLLTTAGAIIFSTSAELITMFLGLETMSMALYCLCGSAISQRRSSEAALKYFLLGSFSSAFLLFGIALVYGATGTTMIADIPAQLAGAHRMVLLLSIGLTIVGLAFKIGAVPFHFWTPDVYEGSPTQVTAYMATVIKAASVATAMRVLWSMFGGDIVFWSTAVWYVALFSMVVGNLVALRQRSIKRMLAYSSIAHAGYMMVGLLATGDQYGGAAAILYYLVAYTVMTIGSFGVVMAVSEPHMQDRFPDDINRFNGLGYRKPALAAAMTLFLLSMAGLPPGMAGLLGKVYIFSAAVKANYIGLTILGVLCSAISCYYYLYVVVKMYFVEGGTGEDRTISVGLPLASVLTICCLAVIFLGVFPSSLYEKAAWTAQASQLLR